MSTVAVGAQVIIRLAQESDRAALESIAARTWNGDDYLASLITPWLADSQGEFYIAALPDGRVVGTAKLTKNGEGEWWMEGMRVDPDFYGHGIGRALHHHLVKQADLRSGVLRFSTEHENLAIHTLAEETGFTLLARFVRYHADGAAHYHDQFRSLTDADIPNINAFLESSAHFQHVQRSTHGLRWMAEYITTARLHGWITQSRVFGWHGAQADPAHLDGLVIFNAPSVQATQLDRIGIGYLDARPGHFAVLANAVRSLAIRLGYSKARHFVLERPELLVAIEQAGWRRPEDASIACLFSRQLNVANPIRSNV